MQVLILTLGTQGDVQPYVALAKGLKTKNHQVTLCTSSYFEPFITNNNIDYQFMNNRFIELINHPCSKTLLSGNSSIWKKLRSLFKLASLSKKIMPEMFIDTWQAAKNTTPDVIIAHPKVLFASHICEKMAIPLIIGSPIPSFEATQEFPLVGLPQLSLFSPVQAQWYNKLTYKLTQKAHHAFDKKINEFRKKHLNLAPCDPHSSPMKNHLNQAIIHMHAFSPEVVAKPHDWREQAYITGYWFLNKSEEWQAPKALNQFIAAGEPPIYIGFGSMAGNNAKQLGELITKAVQLANCRAIIATGWGGIEINNSNLSSNICVIDAAPHDWLFPQMAAVVHHGGAGSTAAALKAGKPSLICPFSMDQPFWGKRVAMIGAGLPPIPQKKLTVTNLAAALIALSSDQLIHEKAQAIGANINKENGIQQAIEIIEQAVLTVH